MENLIKKYEYDMERYEKQLKKMEQLDKSGQPYDQDDVKLSDDEEAKKGDYIDTLAEERIKAEKQYDDEYFKAKEEEKENMEKQYEAIERKLQELGGNTENAPEMSDADKFKEYERIIDDMEQYGDYVGKQQFHEDEAQLQRDEMREFQRLHEQEQAIRDSLEQKRQGRQKLKRTGGAKSESPVWKDE